MLEKDNRIIEPEFGEIGDLSDESEEKNPEEPRKITKRVKARFAEYFEKRRIEQNLGDIRRGFIDENRLRS